MHVANDLIPEPVRFDLYESGETIDPDEIEAGMFVIGRRGNIMPVVARSRPGEPLPEGHDYSIDGRKWRRMDCVCFSLTGAPRGPGRVAALYRDVTEEVYSRLG